MRTIEEIRLDYNRLSELTASSDAKAKRSRGYEFEKLLNSLFTLDELDPRTSYRPTGEQIDGSIYFDGRVYLIEAKWHADPLPASTLYQFKGKVDGKLAGTIGIFISMSGYSEDAVDALALGKNLNIILFDRRDMDAAIIRGNGFRQTLKMKIRQASEEGTIYFPSEADVVTAEKTQSIEISHLSYDRITHEFLSSQLKPRNVDPIEELFIVCEGDTDRVVISTFVERILSKAKSGRSVKIITAMGKLAIPRIVNALNNNFNPKSKILIIADSDNAIIETETMLSNGIESDNWLACIPNPSIENWLGIDEINTRRPGIKQRIEQYSIIANEVDIELLKTKDLEFDKFHKIILGENQSRKSPADN